MIRYALACQACDFTFEAWFASSIAYDEQSKAGQVSCPECEGHSVAKQIMAPAVRGTKRTGGAMPVNPGSEAPESEAAAKALLEAARQHIAQTFEYVGGEFADEARAMHYGETDARPIYGETTIEESKALQEEGVEAVPLPAELTPKKPRNKRKMN